MDQALKADKVQVKACARWPSDSCLSQLFATPYCERLNTLPYPIGARRGWAASTGAR